MGSRNKRLEACISNADLCSCLARVTIGPHIDITNVHKKRHKNYIPQPATRGKLCIFD